MQVNQLSWMIGGPAGSGINTSSEIFNKACVRAGLWTFSNIEYHSNIMGRHMFFRVRVSDEPVRSHVEQVDLLLALDSETIFGTDAKQNYQKHPGHLHHMAPDSVIIIDAAQPVNQSDIPREDVRLLALPYDALVKAGVEKADVTYNARRHGVMRNMVPVGAACALLGFDVDRVVAIVAEKLPARRQDLVELNRLILQAGADAATAAFTGKFRIAIRPVPRVTPTLMMRGVEAIAVAKLHAGCNLQTYYPIAPASDESVYIECQQADYPIVVLQAEDEIASMNMAVGAAHAGARASTSTAGPGFALMAEGMGFAAITEAPGPVVVLYQRGGPSTGLPTRQSQSDLRFALQPAHGEFPHIVVAPGDLREAARYTHLAFNWGDRYQVPVVLLADKYLSNSWFTVPDLGLDGLPVDHGEVWSPETNGHAQYERHALTATGISPRALFGTPGGAFVTTSDEHTARGRIDEDVTNRLQQMDKRMGKLALIGREIPQEDQWSLVGPADGDVLFVAWGSTRGAILDALPVLAREHGIRAGYLQVRLLRPFPAEAVGRILTSAKNPVALEDNYLGQLAMLIAEQTGIRLGRLALKYDGRPFSQDEVVEAGVKHARSDVRRLVLSHP